MAKRTVFAPGTRVAWGDGNTGTIAVVYWDWGDLRYTIHQGPSESGCRAGDESISCETNSSARDFKGLREVRATRRGKGKKR